MAKNFDVQSIALDAPIDKVFSYIADPRNLSKWTKAVAQADEKSALRVTPTASSESASRWSPQKRQAL